MGKARPPNLLNIAAWLISTCSHPHPFCLCLGDRTLAPCALTPYMYMAKTRNQQTSNGRKEAKGIWKRHKADKHDRHGKQRNKKASKQARRQTSKKAKQKVVSTRDKCRFGSNVHDFIVLKHGRHNSKQDSCMDMWASLLRCIESQRVARTNMVSIASHGEEKGRVCTKQPGIWRYFPNGHIQTRPHGCRM